MFWKHFQRFANISTSKINPLYGSWNVDKESEDNLTEKAMIYNNQMTKRGLTEYQKNIN